MIDQIEVEGVTAVPREEIELAMELAGGDALERAKVVRSAKNIQTLYQRRGYHQATVKTELLRTRGAEPGLITVLRFTVQEGAPTRIASFSLVQAGVGDPAQSEEWSRIQAVLAARVPLVRGDVFNLDRISEIRQDLERALSSEQLVGARVNEITARDVPAPREDQDAAKKTETARWVQVSFPVDIGNRVTFGFRGNKRLGHVELMGVIEEQRGVGFGRQYVQEIADRIVTQYRSMGYANVSIAARTFERPARQERHVTYVISEGERVRIDEVAFDGNLVFGDEDLRDQFFERAPLLVQRGYYSEKEVDRAGELLVEWLKSRGYLSAKLITTSRVFIGGMNRVRLVVYLYEGEQTVVERVAIEGAKVFDRVEMLEMLGLREGEPLNLFAFSEGIERVKSAYRESGYLEMAVTNENEEEVVRYAQKNRLASVTVVVDEGVKYKAGSIKVEGLESTDTDIVLRDLAFSEGDVLTAGRISESESNLRRLGIFSSATIRLTDRPGEPGVKDVNVQVKEGTPGLVAGGPGFRTDFGVRGFGEVAYNNLHGRNHTASLSLSANRRLEEFRFTEFRARAGYVWPWFVLPKVTLRPQVIWERRQLRQFDAETRLVGATFERPILENPNLVAGLTYSLERTTQFNAVSTIDNQTLTIGAITPSLTLDLRDNPLAPTSGLYLTTSYEIASTLLGSQRDPFPVGFTRFLGRADGIVPIAPGVSWFLSFRMGFERDSVSAEAPILADGSRDPRWAIPLIKQFTLGGVGSLRGFELQELNHQDKAILGTLTFVNYRTQLDLPLVGDMRFGPFVDAGNLNVDTFSMGGLRYGVGIGLHYRTPVGPVNFDFGFKVDPLPGEDPTRFHFSVGIL